MQIKRQDVTYENLQYNIFGGKGVLPHCRTDLNLLISWDMSRTILRPRHRPGQLS